MRDLILHRPSSQYVPLCGRRYAAVVSNEAM